MAELIGATLDDNPDLRRGILTFDRIARFQLREFMTKLANEKSKASIAADFQFLIDRGVLYEPSLEHRQPDTGSEQTALLGQLEATMVLFRKGEVLEEPAFTRHTGILAGTLTRLYALELRQQHQVNAVPILIDRSLEIDRPSTRSDVVHLVLNQLPMPGPTHSLEDILAFRDEARKDGLIEGLRVWINEMASGKLTPIEVSDKLEHLTSQYERTLKLEKMRRDTSVVETFVTTTAEVAEALAKFQWSKIAKMLFEVRHKQLELMKAELSAPGREVAYIVKARERFGK
jgi:hypothetical protein